MELTQQKRWGGQATTMAEQQQHGVSWITAPNFYQIL